MIRECPKYFTQQLVGATLTTADPGQYVLPSSPDWIGPNSETSQTSTPKMEAQSSYEMFAMQFNATQCRRKQDKSLSSPPIPCAYLTGATSQLAQRIAKSLKATFKTKQPNSVTNQYAEKLECPKM
jgi:hypothetical protein